MQVKVLYSFDNSPTVFLSRSKNQYSVKVAQIPIESTSEQENMLTLGAFDLKHCAQQILKSSPENFRLLNNDYAVYYKDITEQPDEPFVANGVMSALLASQKQHLIPGRVCQNLSASFLFGDKANTSSLTLEIRLKLHVIEKSQHDGTDPLVDMQKKQIIQHPQQQQHQQSNYSISHQLAQRRSRPTKSSAYNSHANAAVKATRTKSLPIYYHPPNQQISNIINADKANGPSKYDNKSIMERFNLAPFLLAKIIDKPASKRKRSIAPLTPTVQTPVDSLHPMRAVRTRSMITGSASTMPMISSPIHEELASEGSDDTEYHDHTGQVDEDDEEEDEEDDDFNGSHGDDLSSPYTPQQPPYKPDSRLFSKPSSTSILSNNDKGHFQSLPDLEDLDSKKTHTIPSTKLPHNHDLICINKNCAANESVTWRYFETQFRPSYLHIQRAEKFDKKLYDGMFGPLCNACFLFLRNKGFMRPEAVVKKYLQQQKYKRELKLREENNKVGDSSPFLNDDGAANFPTPSHAPSAINEVIRNLGNKVVPSINLSKQPTGQISSGLTPSGFTPSGTNGEEYQDLNDFITQLNSFGGPLTDIDLPQEYSGERKDGTPPMMATKSNTRVINLYEEDDKENFPPAQEEMNEFDEMMMRSFSLRSSPAKSDLANLFGEPTPIDTANTPRSSHAKTTIGNEKLDLTKAVKSSPAKLENQKPAVVNMPSSPLLSNFDDILSKNGNLQPNCPSSPNPNAKRNDTTMSYVKERSSPQSEPFLMNEEYESKSFSKNAA